jgi:hypothetical protein
MTNIDGGMPESKARCAQSPDGAPTYDYEVGYKKPPKKHRFQNGHSGNPRGRPRGSTNYLTRMGDALGQKILVVENGKPKQELLLVEAVNQTLKKAASGDLQAFQVIIKLIPLLKPGQMDRIFNFIVEN